MIWRLILKLISLQHYNHIFLDRDGIINHVVMRGSVIGSPRTMDEFVIRPEFLLFYRRIPKNVDLFVVTNQPDISRGLMELSVLKEMHDMLNKSFNFLSIEFCGHDNDDLCLCRKPKPGMIKTLVEQFALNKEKSIMIGDSMKDISCAFNAGIESVLLATDYNKDNVPKDVRAVSNFNQLTF